MVAWLHACMRAWRACVHGVHGVHACMHARMHACTNVVFLGIQVSYDMVSI